MIWLIVLYVVGFLATWWWLCGLWAEDYGQTTLADAMFYPFVLAIFWPFGMLAGLYIRAGLNERKGREPIVIRKRRDIT